jgi:hypothetical protein
LVQEYTLRTILALVASAAVAGIVLASAGKRNQKSVEGAGDARDHAARKTGRKSKKTIREAAHRSSEKVAEGAEKARRKISA